MTLRKEHPPFEELVDELVSQAIRSAKARFRDNDGEIVPERLPVGQNDNRATTKAKPNGKAKEQGR